jgi:hypothetical protein
LPKLQRVLTSAGIRSRGQGAPAGPGLIGKMLPIPDEALTDDKAGQVEEAPNRSLKLCVYVCNSYALCQCILPLVDEIIIKCGKKTARKFRGSAGNDDDMTISGRPSCRPATLASGPLRLHFIRGLWNALGPPQA